MIYTHVHPDLDALASAWLARRLRGGREEVRFVSAGWEGPVPEGDLAVDIACGLKGRADPATGRVSSALRLLLERPEAEPYREPLGALLDLVEAQDTTGHAVETLAGPGVPEAVRAHCLPALVEAARRSLGEDLLLFEWASVVFEGLLRLRREREEERARAARARWFGPVALAEGRAAAELFARGARAVVYHEGRNVGVLRAKDETFHLGAILEPWLRARGLREGWFFHPAGFLACHGSRKSPADRPCPVDPEEIARRIQEFLGTGPEHSRK